VAENGLRAPKVGERIRQKGERSNGYKITRLDGYRVYGKRDGGQEALFDTIDANGRCNGAIVSLWEYVEEVAPAPPPITKRSGMLAPPPEDRIEAAVYAFFTAPKPGNCACNIPRQQCRYHG
jgi:hypothetical protein